MTGMCKLILQAYASIAQPGEYVQIPQQVWDQYVEQYGKTEERKAKACAKRNKILYRVTK